MIRILRTGNPLARAVRMKSLPSASSIAARVMRAIGASANRPSEIAGRTSWASDARNTGPIARDEGVDRVGPGDVRWRREGDLVQAAERLRRPAEQEIEDVDEQQADEEGRERRADGDQRAAGVIDRSVDARRGPHAQRDGHADANSSAKDDNSSEAGSRSIRSVSTGWPVVSEWPRLPCTRSST